MVRNLPPEDIKKIADIFFEHEKKIICEKIRMLTNAQGLKWVEDKTGIPQRQLNRLHSRSANITLYTWCVIKASVQHLGPQQNHNFENNKS